MRFREHRGGLSESLATTIELATKEQFISHIEKLARRIVPTDRITITFSQSSYDKRIGWDTYNVCMEGQGVLGMTDGPPPLDWWPKPKFELYLETE